MIKSKDSSKILERLFLFLVGSMNTGGMIGNREQGAVMARQIMGGQRELVAPPNQPRNFEIQDLSSGSNITSPQFDDPQI